MRLLLTGLVSCTAVIGSLIPSPGDIFQEAAELVESNYLSTLHVEENFYDAQSDQYRKKCTLHPSDSGDDTDGFVDAVKTCGKGGIIDLPDGKYIISRPLELEMEHSTLNIHGWLTFTTDIDYWIKNRIYWPFQNQSLALVFKGHHYTLDGHDTGGIDGNGQVWYDAAKEFGNMYGRPMSLAISHSHDVVIKNFSIVQPQFWASLVTWSENVLMKDVYVNATSYNPESYKSKDGKSWLQNTDGLDTYNAHNVTVENFVYQGGDDCLALKPNSTSIVFRNITCTGGTGIAFGSIAQYKGVTDILEDILVEDVKLIPAPENQCTLFQGLLLKAWGAESYGEPPNGGGGGQGYARNITIRNVYMKDIIRPIVLQSTLTYLSDKKMTAGNFQWEDIRFENITGNALYNRLIWADCPANHPCRGMTFKDIDLTPGRSDHQDLNYVCNNFVLGPEDGLNECHPSNSKLEVRENGTPHSLD